MAGVHFMVGVAERLPELTDDDGPPMVVNIRLGVEGQGQVEVMVPPDRAGLIGEAILAATRAAKMADREAMREAVRDLQARLAAVSQGEIC